MSEEITGVVEARNEKGIKVRDQWLNVSRYRPVDLPPKDTLVTVVTDKSGRYIEEIRWNASGNGADGGKQGRPDWETKDRRITRMAAVNSAIAYAQLKTAGDDEARAKLKLEHVLKHAAEIEAWVLREEEGGD